MKFSFRTVSATATSLFAIGVLGTCSPATSAWANDYAKQLNVGTIAPATIGEPAKPQTDSPSAPEADVIEEKITAPEVKAIEAAKPDAPARSLSALVQRHADTNTANRETECLAIATYFESKGEPVDGQLAVAQTVLNRAKSGRFPGSVCGVVLQPKQFSFVRGGGFPPIARSSQQWKTAVAIAHIARNNLWSSSVANALFFHARHVSPGWRLKRIASVGNHVFYR